MNTAYIMMFSFSLLVGLIMLAAGVILHRALQPLHKLGRAAEQLSQGCYTEIDAASYPEIDDPIKSFNIMARKMTSLISALENEIAERHKVEDELRRHRSQLEDTVVSRTVELEIARDQALEASKAKSTFLANMSHELRTPLTAIIGYSEMLFEDARDDGRSEYVPDLEKIIQAGKHLMELINSVLDISKIEAGKMEVCLEEVEIAPMIDELVATVGSLASKSGNSVVVECPADIGSMMTDKMKLKQILLNLLSNANKFTHNGQVSLSVRREEHDGRKWVDFSVVDNGIGIDKGEVEKLFEEFSQANPTTTRKYGGTGLGLAITLNFTEMLGGHVTVFSVPGTGSIFSVKLPEDCACDISQDRKVLHINSPGEFGLHKGVM